MMGAIALFTTIKVGLMDFHLLNVLAQTTEGIQLTGPLTFQAGFDGLVSMILGIMGVSLRSLIAENNRLRNGLEALGQKASMVSTGANMLAGGLSDDEIAQGIKYAKVKGREIIDAK